MAKKKPSKGELFAEMVKGKKTNPKKGGKKGGC